MQPIFILVVLTLITPGIAIGIDDAMLGDSPIYDSPGSYTTITPHAISGFELKAYANEDSITIVNLGSSPSPNFGRAVVINDITNEMYAMLPPTVILGKYDSITVRLNGNVTVGQHLYVSNGIGTYADAYVAGYQNA
jgi:hypothetical protein